MEIAPARSAATDVEARSLALAPGRALRGLRGLEERVHVGGIDLALCEILFLLLAPIVADGAVAVGLARLLPAVARACAVLARAALAGGAVAEGRADAWIERAVEASFALGRARTPIVGREARVLLVA